MKVQTPVVAGALGALAIGAPVATARPSQPVAHAAGLGNKIVLYKSIGGVRLGMTPAQARRQLGKPAHTIRMQGKVASYDFERGGNLVISIEFDTLNKRDLANFVAGYKSAMHTSKGIHPGSTVRQLKRAYGRALHHFPGGYALYKGTPGSSGSRRTDFATFQGKVQDIDIQAVFNDL